MSDVLIFSYNPFDPSLTDNLNNWVRLVYNQVPSPSPSPTPNPNPLPYPDTGINLLSLSLLFLFLSGVGISLYFYRKNRYVQTTHI
jgi:hypothetical protein